MQKHSSGLTLASISFDTSIEDSVKALRRHAGQNPVLARLQKLGVATAGGDVKKSVLEVLRKEGVVIDKASENAVLATIKTMGADFERLALLEQDPFRVVFGKNAALYMVPENLQDLFYQAIGRNSLPTIFVVDRQGKLRYAGYPVEGHVAKLVETLLAEPPPS